jgi:hypothetical protein
MSIFNSINNAFNTVSNSFNMVKAALSSLKTQPDSIGSAGSGISTIMQEKTSAAMDYMFVVEMPDIYEVSEEVPQSYASSFKNSFKKMLAPSKIHHRVYSVDVPNITFGAEKAHVGGSHYFMAGHRDYGNLTIRIDEYEDGATQQYISQWMSMIKNENNTYNVPALYKKRIIVYRVSMMGGDPLTRIELVGCFPTNITVSEFNTDGSSVSQFTVTFTVDGVKYLKPSFNRNADSIAEQIKQDIIRQSKPINFEANQLLNIFGRFF